MNPSPYTAPSLRRTVEPHREDLTDRRRYRRTYVGLAESLSFVFPPLTKDQEFGENRLLKQRCSTASDHLPHAPGPEKNSSRLLCPFFVS